MSIVEAIAQRNMEGPRRRRGLKCDGLMAAQIVNVPPVIPSGRNRKLVAKGDHPY
jgi:hypothetical protein